jgi:hypothetical protein
MPVWYMDIDTDVKFKAGGEQHRASLFFRRMTTNCSKQKIQGSFY